MTYYRHVETGSVYEFDHAPKPEGQWETMTDKEGRAAQHAGYLASLRALCPVGSTVYTVLRHRSASGMRRCISLFAIVDGAPQQLDYLIHKVTGAKIHRDHGGLITDGCGMDMGFHRVYGLGRALYPEGFGIEGKRANGKPVRPASPKSAAALARAGATFHGRNRDASGWDYDGGYALGHRWL